MKFLLALSFLTALPVRTEDPKPGDLGQAAIWFPVVGLALGALLAAAHYLFSLIFQPLLTAALLVTLWAALTGGLHLDGLADCCDGLFATATPERRLEIMRDPRLGSFGVIGLTLFLVLKVLGISFVTPLASAPLWLMTPTLARWLMLIVALQPAARPGGLGANFALGLKPGMFLLAALAPAALAVIFFNLHLLIAVAVAHLLTFGVILVARARLGGMTGDVLGLTVELGELSILLTFAARL